MLYPLPPSPAPFIPGIRRRGGQPSNHNALKHGFFAVYNPTPFTPHLDPIQSGFPLFSSTPLSPSMSARPGTEAGHLHSSPGEQAGKALGFGLGLAPGQLLDLYTHAIQSIRQQLALTFDAASRASDFKSRLTWQRTFLRHMDLFLRYQRALARHQQPQLHLQLQLLAAHPLALIRRDFQDKKLPSPSGEGPGERSLPSQEINPTLTNHSFRANLKLSDFNSKKDQDDAFMPESPSLHSFLTATQWALLEPILLDQELPSPLVGLVPERAEGPGERFLPPQDINPTLTKHSFRANLKLSDFNSNKDRHDPLKPESASPHSFLTASQWALLEPILNDRKLPSHPGEDPSVKSTSDRELPSLAQHPVGANLSLIWGGDGGGVSRGRPPSNPLPLLDAILWKIAHHARWQDLPAGSPPMLTCRRYYRRLSLSSRLLQIYTALHCDFLARSGTDLPTLVDQGAFSISGTSIVLSSSAPDTWQTRTALLLMQLAYQSFRRLLHKTAPQPPAFPAFDFRKLPNSNSPRMNPDEP